MATMTIEQIIEQLRQLPQSKQDEAAEQLSLFIKKYGLSLQAQPIQKRRAGLHAGYIEVREDFDDPLPDEFWSGQA